MAENNGHASTAPPAELARWRRLVRRLFRACRIVSAPSKDDVARAEAWLAETWGEQATAPPPEGEQQHG